MTSDSVDSAPGFEVGGQGKHGFGFPQFAAGWLFYEHDGVVCRIRCDDLLKHSEPVPIRARITGISESTVIEEEP